MAENPTPKLHKRVITKDDGRTLILYHFTTGADEAPAPQEGETP